MIKLSIELIPKNAWFANLRTSLSKKEWEACKKFVSNRSGRKCEICGGVGERHPVECHEIWEYDDINQVQTLKDLIALCPNCHMVKHIGLAQINGNFNKAVLHFININNVSQKDAIQYIKEVFDLWAERSTKNWTMNIDNLEKILKSNQ